MRGLNKFERPLYLYLGHRKRGGWLNFKYSGPAREQSVVVISGADFVIAVRQNQVRWRAWDDAIAVTTGELAAKAEVIHGVSHRRSRLAAKPPQ